MKQEIIQKNKNPFLNREELLIEIISETSPSFEDVKKFLGKDEKVVIVRKIHSNFGKKRFLAEVFVYDSLKDKDTAETIPKKVRKKLAEERKASEATAKKAKEEAKKIAEAQVAKTQEAKTEEKKE